MPMKLAGANKFLTNVFGETDYHLENGEKEKSEILSNEVIQAEDKNVRFYYFSFKTDNFDV